MCGGTGNRSTAIGSPCIKRNGVGNGGTQEQSRRTDHCSGSIKQQQECHNNSMWENCTASRQVGRECLHRTAGSSEYLAGVNRN